jgi:hypothetical protein
MTGWLVRCCSAIFELIRLFIDFIICNIGIESPRRSLDFYNLAATPCRGRDVLQKIRERKGLYRKVVTK